MNCRDIYNTLTEGTGESAQRAAERHLADCPVCAARLQVTNKVRHLLKERAIGLRAPEALRLRILADMPHRAA